MATSEENISSASQRLGRIRCVQECIKCFINRDVLPIDLCYVPLELQYKTTKSTILTLYENPSRRSKLLKNIICGIDQTVVTSGEEECNNEGQWTRLLKVVKRNSDGSEVVEEAPAHNCLLLYSSLNNSDQTPAIVPKKEVPSGFWFEEVPYTQWEEVLDNAYTMQVLSRRHALAPVHAEARERLRCLPANWTSDHDDDLAQFLSVHTERENESLGSIKNYVDSVDVSTYAEEEGADKLTDGDPETYWESDGHQGQHWIRLKMRKGTLIQKLLITVDPNDDNYLPQKISVLAGTTGNMQKVNDLTVDLNTYGLMDICVLESQKEHHPVIEIRIRECKDDGIDTRIHGIKIKSVKEKELGLNKDLFDSENLVRFPRLESFSKDTLYCRAVALQRFITVLDSVLPFMVPAWPYSEGTFDTLKEVRQLLQLSRQRSLLIDNFLRASETGRPSRMPTIYINRRLAAEHKEDPRGDEECKNTVFMQVYGGLIPRDRGDKNLDYRWPARYDQWWECKFVAEGIIDQGGGFRDSLSDIAEELCPSDRDQPLPLPFFVRAPNQHSADSNVNKDVYIPNPDCELLEKYEWIGKLMGACLRGKECLVLSLPPFIWKKLSGEPVSWSKDYKSIDEAEVRLMDAMESMDPDTYTTHCGEDRTWSLVLSHGKTISLREDGEITAVAYTDRREYVRQVREARMAESDTQTFAIREGLLRVVPQTVLDLLTWQELEKRICGDPDITIEALRRSTHYKDLSESDPCVTFLWQALESFSLEDRSRFLRFVTGRRRLPAPIFVCPIDGEDDDILPESSTCANTLYLPDYTSGKLCEEKLRYAIYNCVAIDTDVSPWDE